MFFVNCLFHLCQLIWKQNYTHLICFILFALILPTSNILSFSFMKTTNFQIGIKLTLTISKSFILFWITIRHNLQIKRLNTEILKLINKLFVQIGLSWSLSVLEMQIVERERKSTGGRRDKERDSRWEGGEKESIWLMLWIMFR